MCHAHECGLEGSKFLAIAIWKIGLVFASCAPKTQANQRRAPLSPIMRGGQKGHISVRKWGSEDIYRVMMGP